MCWQYTADWGTWRQEKNREAGEFIGVGARQTVPNKSISDLVSYRRNLNASFGLPLLSVFQNIYLSAYPERTTRCLHHIKMQPLNRTRPTFTLLRWTTHRANLLPRIQLSTQVPQHNQQLNLHKRRLRHRHHHHSPNRQNRLRKRQGKTRHWQSSCLCSTTMNLWCVSCRENDTISYSGQVIFEGSSILTCLDVDSEWSNGFLLAEGGVRVWRRSTVSPNLSSHLPHPRYSSGV